MTDTSKPPEAPKKFELSGEYYNHKRASLLASAVFLGLSVPGIDLSGFEFVGIKLADKNNILVPMLTGLIAAYYLLHYFMIWRTEASRYARSEASQTNEAFEQLKTATATFSAMVKQAGTLVASLHKNFTAATPTAEEQEAENLRGHTILWDIAENADDPAASEALAKNTSDFLLERYLLHADGTGQIRLRADLNHGSFQNPEAEPLKAVRDAMAQTMREPLSQMRKVWIQRSLAALREQRPDLILFTNSDEHAARIVRADLPRLIKQLNSSGGELRKARRMFQQDQRALWFRTSVLDWWVPLGLFVAAAGLFAWTHLPRH